MDIPQKIKSRTTIGGKIIFSVKVIETAQKLAYPMEVEAHLIRSLEIEVASGMAVSRQSKNCCQENVLFISALFSSVLALLSSKLYTQSNRD